MLRNDLRPIFGQRPERILNMPDHLVQLVRQQRDTRVLDTAKRNAPGIRAAQHRITPADRIRTAIAERRLITTIATRGMADQDNLATLNLDVDPKIDEITAATTARKINHRKTAMEKCVLDRQHRLRKQRLRNKYNCTYVQSIAETAKEKEKPEPELEVYEK